MIFSFKFNDPTEISIYQVFRNTQYYLLKKQKRYFSNINTQTFSFGAPQQFPTIDINAENIIGILDIVDSDGNTWYEVDYLGQEMVFDNIKNTNTNDPNNVEMQGCSLFTTT